MAGVDLHGTLDRPQLRCLASLLQRSIYVASALPNTETDFPVIKIAPSNFISQMMVENVNEELNASMYIAEEHAAMVVDKDPRLLSQEGLSESMKEDQVDADNSVAEDGNDEDRMTTVVFWLRNKTQNTEHTRELLNSTRDVVIRCIRACIPGDPDVMDHMIAGAYMRTMMVVNSPEHGPRAQTALFSVASFEDQPQTLVFKFVAGADAIEPATEPTDMPNCSPAMISLNAADVTWLGSDVALNVARAPATSSDSNAEGLKSEIESWEQASSVAVPSVYFRTVSETSQTDLYAGPTTVVTVGEKKTPYCDQLWNDVSSWATDSCFCCYRAEPPQTPAPVMEQHPAQIKSRQPSRTLVQPLIR
jgi:hypothetical protein